MDHSNKTDIRIEGLRTGYDKTVIIDNLNLTIPRGKVTALIGSNGCGKSTLLKTICRIITPMSGTVYLDGQDIHKENTKVLAKKMLFCRNIRRHRKGLPFVNLSLMDERRIRTVFSPV